MLNYPKLRNIWGAEKDYILQSHFYVWGYKTHSVRKVIYELEITTKDRESLEKKTKKKDNSSSRPRTNQESFYSYYNESTALIRTYLLFPLKY